MEHRYIDQDILLADPFATIDLLKTIELALTLPQSSDNRLGGSALA